MSDFASPPVVSPGHSPPAAENLLPLVYAELRKRASTLMAAERSDHTLQPTALVHEAWLRLAERSVHSWKDRAHFLACAAEAMRWVLVDHARRRRSLRRGGEWARVEMNDDTQLLTFESADELIALNAALERLQQLHPPKAQLVKLRYFAGVTLEEAGQVLGVSEPTAKRHWAFARAWLFREMRRQ